MIPDQINHFIKTKASARKHNLQFVESTCMKIILFFITLLFIQFSLPAQIALTAGGYTENFNTLAASGTATTLPAWWAFIETGTNANNTYTANNGSNNAGDTYSYGSSTSAERAFGTLQSGSLVSRFGATFNNAAGSAITSISITYWGEQWRLGATGRTDSLLFSYATGGSFQYAANWIAVPALHFASPVTSGTVGALDGNLPANSVLKTATITGLNIAVNDTFSIRWTDFNASGADDGLAVDSFSISINTTADTTPPTIASLNPANNAMGVSLNPALQITFSEAIQKGSGNIFIKKFADNSTAITIDVNTSAVTVNGSLATINVAGLVLNTQYYVEMAAGVFKDLANNNFAGISGNSTWSFTTQDVPTYHFDFNTCIPFDSVNVTGWKQYSVTGDSIWKCTSFGAGGSHGVQMSGFVNPTGPAINEDWLISPSLDLALFNIPVLSFFARTKFFGNRIDVMVSTNYSGAGNPNAATWTVLSAMLPLENSDLWTMVDSINLVNYKTANTFIAFRYTSTTNAAARWTLDDIRIGNTATAPGPRLQVTNPILNFDNIAAGSSSAARSFQFAGINISGNLIITAPAFFLVSKDNASFASSISYSAAEVAHGYKTVYARYSPTAANTVHTGFLNFTSTNGLNGNKVEVAGNSYSFATTLDIINWNLEWFGSATNGPADNNLQQANAKRVMDSLQADIYTLCEIVDTTRLMNLANSLGGYAYKVSDYCSNAADPADPDYANGQKLAFIYKTSVVTNVKARGFLKTSTAASSNWASGRVPFLMEADIVNGTATKKYVFLLLHGKAGNTGSDYQRRKDGAKEMKDSLDAQFSNANVVILGDYNDDIDSTISTGIVPALTSYDDLIKDSTDTDSYKALTMPLSLAGLRSTISNPDVVDHVAVSNELAPDVIQRSAKLVKEVETWISDYANTTSDHYPVMSRSLLPAAVTGLPGISPDEIELKVNPNPAKEELFFSFKPAAGTVQIDLINLTGRPLMKISAFRTASVRQTRSFRLAGLPPGVYFLKITNNQKQVSHKFIKL
jgi:hypothetical protein